MGVYGLPSVSLRSTAPLREGSLFLPAGGTGVRAGLEPASTGVYGCFCVGEGSKPSRFLICAERRNLFWEQGNIVAAGATDPTSSLPFPARAGKAATRGRWGEGGGVAHDYGLDPSVSSADSSPYEGEPKRTGLRLAPRILSPAGWMGVK